MPCTSPTTWVRRLLTGSLGDDVSSEPPRPEQDPAATRADRARHEARRWLELRQREFERRLEERRGRTEELVDAE